MHAPFEVLPVSTPTFASYALSDELQAVIGQALVDRAFHDLLLANPRKALAGFELAHRDRAAATAIRGASSLAEYALRLEQRLARIRHRLLVRELQGFRPGAARAAS